jgi:putative zinc finger/helix-turn-helix YgiT family protein
MRLSTADHNYTVVRGWAVKLADASVAYCPACEARTVSVARPKALARTIAAALLQKRELLCGDEITFLRNCLARQGRQLAKELGIQPETLSRYEQGTCRINPSVDRLIRAMVALWYLPQGVGAFTAEMAAVIAPRGSQPLSLRLRQDSRGAWRPEAN